MTAELATVDRSAVSVVSMLEHAKQWLATAVETTGPAEIAAAKAQIVTAETYARELHLSQEIQLDAAEMVRRAEYALGKSIRKGQEEGTVRTRADGPAIRDGILSPTGDKFSPRDVLGTSKEYQDVNVMVGAVDFDGALDEAKAEGNLSRANVVRKVRQQKVGAPSVVPSSRDARADLIEDLAAQGYSSRQMPAKVGVTEESVRQIARDYQIEIPADRSIARTRRINSTDVVVNTATALEGLISGIELIRYEDVDPAQAGQWIDSLTDSLKKLRRFVEQIKETTHD